MPHEVPPWLAIDQQTRWGRAPDVFAAIITDLRQLICLGRDRVPQPTAIILDSRAPQSPPESEHRAG